MGSRTVVSRHRGTWTLAPARLDPARTHHGLTTSASDGSRRSVVSPIWLSSYTKGRSSVGWASAYIRKLRAGETVSFRPRGHSMKGGIESGQLCTVTPVDLSTL